MNWQQLKTAADGTHFLMDGAPVFNKKFIEVLKFHAPGLAPVTDESGSYHIDTFGNALYPERYARTFGFYDSRAAVIQGGDWFHLTQNGAKAYSNSYTWTGNFQENLCTVRDKHNNYFHIDLDGNNVYPQHFLYCGDFKDGFACAKSTDGLFRHIDKKGRLINSKSFLDLGIFHKNFATAKDENGWHHIDKNGNALYSSRFLTLEPFYNGFALATQFNNTKIIIDEFGTTVLEL